MTREQAGKIAREIVEKIITEVGHVEPHLGDDKCLDYIRAISVIVDALMERPSMPSREEFIQWFDLQSVRDPNSMYDYFAQFKEPVEKVSEWPSDLEWMKELELELQTYDPSEIISTYNLWRIALYRLRARLTKAQGEK